MPAEAATAADDVAPRELPTLQPILVVDEEQVDELARAARADIALLSLQLRTLPPPSPPPAPPDIIGPAEVLLRTSLEQCLDTRRRELQDELEQVRADAAAHVAAARHEAATVVADATEETLQVLLRGLRPLGSAPALRIVTDDTLRRAPQPAPGPALESSPVASHPAGGAHAGAAEGPSVTIDAERAATDVTVASGAADDPLGATDAPADASARPRTGAGQSAFESSVARAVSSAIAEVFQAGMTGPIVLAAAPPAASALVPAVAASPAPAPVAETMPAATPRGVARFLYADVLLPMIAVVIVLVILLAWVG